MIFGFFLSILFFTGFFAMSSFFILIVEAATILPFGSALVVARSFMRLNWFNLIWFLYVFLFFCYVFLSFLDSMPCGTLCVCLCVCLRMCVCVCVPLMWIPFRVASYYDFDDLHDDPVLFTTPPRCLRSRYAQCLEHDTPRLLPGITGFISNQR